MRENAETVETVIAARALFHSILLKSTANKLLEGMTALVFANLVFHFNLKPHNGEERQLIEHYAALYKAIDQNKPKLAEDVMQRLLVSGRANQERK